MVISATSKTRPRDMPLQPDVINDRLRVLYKSMGQRYAIASFDSFRYYRREDQMALQREAVAKVRGYLVDLADRVIDGGGLILSGSVGTGKDHLMASAAIEATKRGFGVTWRDGDTFFGEVHQFRGAVPDERTAAVLAKRQILAISDPVPPCGFLDPKQSAWLKGLIHARYKARRPTWVSINANLSGDNHREAAEMFTPQIWDRLRHGSTIVNCAWEAYRVPRQSNARRPTPAEPEFLPLNIHRPNELTPEQIAAAERFTGRLRLHGIGFDPKSPPSVLSLSAEQADAIKIEQARKVAERNGG